MLSLSLRLPSKDEAMRSAVVLSLDEPTVPDSSMPVSVTAAVTWLAPKVGSLRKASLIRDCNAALSFASGEGGAGVPALSMELVEGLGCEATAGLPLD